MTDYIIGQRYIIDHGGALKLVYFLGYDRDRTACFGIQKDPKIYQMS